MEISHKQKRAAARKLFLTNACETNAEIGRRLGLKPHTVARYRKEEDWDGLKLGINRNAAKKMAEQLTNERVSLNVQHYTYFEVALSELRSTLKGQGRFSIREVCDVMAAIEKAQKGQRLAKGVGDDEHTEEQIRAEAQAQLHRLLDVFISAVKENVSDEQARERIRKAVLAALFQEPDGGAGDSENEVAE